MLSAEERDLADLRHHWDTAYRINMLTSPLGEIWWAQSRDKRQRKMSAETAEELRALIRADYVPRGGARLRP